MTLTPQTLKFNEEYSQPGISFVERKDSTEFRKVQGHGGHSVSRIDVTTMEIHQKEFSLAQYALQYLLP